MDGAGMDKTIEWLLEGEPWVEYRTRLDLLGLSENDCSVINSKGRMLLHPQITELFSDIRNWQSQVVSNHKNAGLPLHKLAFAADIGISIKDDGMGEIADSIMEHMDENGVLQVLINIPKHFGGSGENTWGWVLCDTPTVFYSLAGMGVDRELLARGIWHLTALMSSNGWRCVGSTQIGKFRGPGKKEDPCPYATLVMLKLLSQIDDLRNDDECKTGAEVLLGLWERSKELHPYMFYMGTDFRKLKAPTVWYDIVNVADVLSRFEWLRNDPRLIEIINVIKSKEGHNGRFTPESEYKACSGWDFGQKKMPSRWLTFLVLRLMKRMAEC